MNRWNIKDSWGFPGGSVVKNPPANAGDAGSIPGWGRSPGEGNGNPLQFSFFFFFFPTLTPVFLTGKSHGQRSLAGYNPWGDRVRHNLVTKRPHHCQQRCFCYHRRLCTLIPATPGLNTQSNRRKIHFVMLFIGANKTSFQKHFLGLSGIPPGFSYYFCAHTT